jgi:nucleoid-associated protein YgaU
MEGRSVSLAGPWGVAAVSGAIIVAAMASALWWRAQVPQPQMASPRPQVAAAPPVGASPSPAVPTPAPAPAAPPAPEAPRADVVRVLPSGEVVIAGRAAPGARVALLDNGQTLMEGKADPTTGEFVFLPPRLPAGQHQLALQEQAQPGGEEKPRRDLTAFAIAGPPAKPEPQAAAASPAAAPGAAPAASSAAAADIRISKGDTLWRISRQKLGRGSLYESIVQANSGKIRDPNLIYPGQALDLPR